jgi:hypothetical protein
MVNCYEVAQVAETPDVSLNGKYNDDDGDDVNNSNNTKQQQPFQTF